MNKDIVKFISKQKTASICTTDTNGNPYCFSCFFAYDADHSVLFYKTHADSHHAALMMIKKEVAGTILPDRTDPVIVRGLQFEGRVLSPDHPMAAHASSKYHLRFPFALAMPGDLWAIQVDHIKMTDSSKGFGYKVNWERDREEVT